MTPAKLKPSPILQADVDSVDDILERAARLSPEGKRKLLSMGCVLPNMAGGDPMAMKWAYRCPHCGGAGLYFVGNKFHDQNGNELDRPPVGMPIDLIPWHQDRPLQEINRQSPSCQACKNALPLNGRSLIGKHIVSWSDYLASRAKVAQELEATRMQRARGGLADGAGKGAEGLSSDFARSQPMQKPSQYLSPEAVTDIKAIEAAGLTAGVSRGE